MPRYIQKLQCPKCKSYDCQLYEEIVHIHITRVNKKTGWLRKRSFDYGESGIMTNHFECNNCGYGHSINDIVDNDNSEFIIDEKEVN